MLFNRKTVGLEVSQAGFLMALLAGTVSAPRLERLVSRPLMAGILRPSLRESNIADMQAFSDKLREAYALLLHRGTRISVSLPDSVGKVLVMDMEERFKSRAEGFDIIRWKLKKNLPFELADCHLDYQFLRKKESGEQSLLVTLVSRSVIEQYEAAITAAGLSPVSIDLNAFNLYRSFDRTIATLEEGVLISFYGGILGINFFSDGVPEFIRFKEMPDIQRNPGQIYSEISNSLLVYREKFAERQIKSVHCITDPGVSRDFCDMLEELCGAKPVLLEAGSVFKPSKDAPSDQKTIYPFTAAIGAAVRSL